MYQQFLNENFDFYHFILTQLSPPARQKHMNGRGICLVSQTTSPETEISPPRKLTKSCPMG